MKLSKKIKYLCTYVWKRVSTWVENNYEIGIYLGGACVIASYALYRILKHKGFSPTLVMAMDKNEYHGHCWVELDDTVIDLTPRQFDPDLPDILYSKRKTYPSRIPKIKEYINIKTNNDAIKEFDEWLIMQQPVIYKSKLNRLITESNYIGI